MILYLKKIISVLLSFFLIFYSLQVFASWSFNTPSFTVANISQSSSNASIWYWNPEDIYSLKFYSKNWWDAEINNVFVDFLFSDWFSEYIWAKKDTTVSWVNPENLTEDDFLPWVDNTAPVTDILPAWKYWVIQDFQFKLDVYYMEVSWIIKWDNASDSSEKIVKIYTNIKPHITDYFFSKSSLKNNWSDSVDLTVKVKDYNWCENIDWWTVFVDLSQLWLSLSESLIYNSCVDWNTAIFKKTWIQTTESVWDKIFTYDLFSATDEDWNSIMPNDNNTAFDDEDKKDDLVLSITEESVPNVNISNLSDNYIWPNEPTNPDSQITFSWDQNWEYKVVVNWNWNCSEWIIISDWTSYTNWSNIVTGLNSSDLSIEWWNIIYTCIKNWDWDIWSANIWITKDSVSPTVNSIIISPASVTTQNSSISFKCWEDWQYKVEKVSPSSYVVQNWTNVDWWEVISSEVTNDHISMWENTVEIYCKDNAWNIWTWSWNITKQDSTPSMSWKVSSLSDNDISWNWIDWRDISISWDTSVWEWFSWFESYRIYILPSNIVFDKNTHDYVWLVPDSNVWTWIWSSILMNDSAWNVFEDWEYKAYVAIKWSSWELWEPWSKTWNLVFDNITNPTLQNAKFIWDTSLELEFDLDLKTSTWEHLSYSDDSIVTYEIWWNTFTWTSVLWVNWKKIQIQIPSLWNTSSTWWNLFLWAWSIRENGWWYISETWWFLISDWINPNISWFSLDSTVSFTTWSWANFYTWNLDFSYNFSEEMKWWWDTKFEFTRESWNIDSDPHFAYLTSWSDLSSWNKNYSIDINSLNLISWTCYKVKIIWEDLAENVFETGFVTNICYDNIWPSIPTLIPFPNNLNEDDNYSAEKRPVLTWFSSEDNENESWFKEYNIQVSLNPWFDPVFIDTNISTESYTFWDDLSDWQYYWKIRWIDEIWNTWTYSLVSDFEIDASSATISNIRFNDLTRWVNNVDYSSKNRTIDILADVSNSSGACIWADLTNIWWSTWVLADSFVWWVASWTWIVLANNISEWLKLITLDARNSQCLPTYHTLWKDLWIDNTDPVIWTWITFPINWDYLTWFWTWETKIHWDTSSIDEDNFNYLKINFFDWTSWENIWNNLLNLWEFSYDFADLNINNAKIKLAVFDNAWNMAEQVWTEFVLDSIIPNFSWSTILEYPNWWESFKWWENISIIWSWELITDLNLQDSPISLFYSTDWWINFSLISENLVNNWNFSWTIPSLNSETIKIKILAKDKSWNENFDLSDGNFLVDSTKPTKIFSEILDLDKNWKVDTVKIIFSEKILDSTVNIWDFSLDNGYTINNFNPNLEVDWIADISDDEKIYLSINEKSWNCNSSDQNWCDTDVELNLTFTWWNLSDLVWNLADNFTVNIIDKVSPILLWREFFDINNDWVLDQIKFYFSETMDASQVSNNSFELQKISWSTLDETYDQGQADWNVLILWFNWWTSFDTYNTIQTKIKTSEFMDLSWNSVEIDNDFVNSNDKAKPVFRAITQKDWDQYQIKVNFSENINISSTWTWNISDWITINSTSTWSNFILFNTSDFSETWLKPTVEYSVVWNIADWSWNSVNTWSVVAIDNISPEILSAEILDSNSNWNIDEVKLTFSENIDDSTLTVWDFAIWTSSATSFETWTEDDNVLNIKFSTEIVWTEIKDLIFSWNDFKDLNWNIMDTVSSSDLTEVDKAWPSIISAYYIEWASVEDDELIINFSENISDVSLNISDFEVEWTWSFENWTIATWTSNDNQIKIELNNWDVRLVIWTSKIKFSWVGKTEDLNTNLNTQTSWITVNWSVIINEINWAWSSASWADEYIELKNMWSSTVDISNWVIENALDWWNLTIPGSTEIAWNWYFLISNFAETNWSSKLDISPDLVNSDLNLADSWNWNLVLKDSVGNTIDSVKWNSWPAWDSINFYSMERKVNPWDWLNSDSWYTADWRVNLDSWTEKGTPWAENIFDANPPVFDLNTKYPLENKLHLISQPEISIEFSDALTWIDTTNSKLYLDWDQDWVCDAAAKDSAVFTQNKVSIIPGAAMPWWKNKVCITLFDNAWNSSNISWDFWIEKFSFNVEEIEEFKEVITPTIDEIFEWKNKIVITTYWAWVDISTQIQNLISWDDEIRDQDLFYDSKIYKKVWEWNTELIHNYNWYLDSSNTSIESFSKVEDLTVDWELKTYEIYLKYKFNINAIQPTWNYAWNIKFMTEISY